MALFEYTVEAQSGTLVRVRLKRHTVRLKPLYSCPLEPALR